MGVPDDNCPVAPVRKRPRLSLKSTKQKVDALTKTKEEDLVKPENQSFKEEAVSDGEEAPVTESTSTESLSSADKDNRVPAVASLENFGNTCFMNSILQVLRYTPGFLENLAQLFQDIAASEKIKRKNKNNNESEEACSFEESNCKKCWKVVRNVYKVYRDLSLLEDKYEEVASDDVMSMAVKPSRILSSVRDLNPMFEGNLQHDAQEFLRCLLCYLQDAEKEVQKFYNQLPPRLSPRAVVLNPIMQRFLKAAQKAGKAELGNSPRSDVTQLSVKNFEGQNDVVKVNLFPKDDVEEKTEAARSPSKIQVGPNLGDTASIVDKKSTTDIQSGSLPKANKIIDSNIDTNTGRGSSAQGRPSRSRGMARRGRRFTPYRLNAEKKEQESKLNDKNVKIKKAAKDASLVVKSQPCISDVFGFKTYSTKKRLGMSSAIVKKTSEELFDEIKNSSEGNKPTMNTSSPRKSQSLPVLNGSSYNDDLQPFVSLTDLHSKISPDIKPNIKPCDNNTNAKSEKSDDNLPESSSGDLKDVTIVEESLGSKPNGLSSEANRANDSRSFQDIFAQFLQVPIFDSDSDSVDLLTDSDNEDIVMQKKVAKQIHESPRRSPRKLQECYLSSAKKSQSLPAQNELTEYSSPRKILSFESKNKLSLNRSSATNSPTKFVSKANHISESIDGKRKNINEIGVLTEDNSNHVPDVVMKDPSSASIVEMGTTNLLPIIKLEKCDHVFDNSNSKTVNANYAAKCLTPQKNSPKKLDLDNSSNYLKRRNLLADFDIKDENDLQKAIEEMYNSPVKSRSKCDLIERLFQGSMILRTRCLQCESSTERKEDFHDVSVPVRLEHSDSDDDDEEDGEADSRCGLMKLIEASTEVEKLLEDNKYYCEECKCYVEAERSMLYDIMPDILTLHLKRFCATSGKFSSITKINDEVEIPFTLPCLRYRCPKVCLRPDHRYSLYAVVTHSGVTLTAGHYLAYVRAMPKPTDQNSGDMENDLGSNIKEEFEKNAKSEKEDEKAVEPSAEKSGKKVPATRRKMGITAKLPSRFDDSVTDTKIKTFKGTCKTKSSKTHLADCLIPSKGFDTEWFECDDETVRVFTEEDFKDMVDGRSGAMLGTPYLLFYHKATLI